MPANWVAIYNRIFPLIDRRGEDSYFSGPRFIRHVQEIKEDFPNYSELMNGRSEAGLSTSRRDYFKDILLGLNEGQRFRLISGILDEVERFAPLQVSEIRSVLGQEAAAPLADIPSDIWSGRRLNAFLRDMDTAIADRQYERTVTLGYTCLEGFLGAFVRAKAPRDVYPHEIITLAREVKDFIKTQYPEHPDEVVNLVTQAAHAVNRARDRFSESHFGGEAGRWLAMYIRDVVNTQIRLLLNFM